MRSECRRDTREVSPGLAKVRRGRALRQDGLGGRDEDDLALVVDQGRRGQALELDGSAGVEGPALGFEHPTEGEQGRRAPPVIQGRLSWS